MSQSTTETLLGILVVLLSASPVLITLGYLVVAAIGPWTKRRESRS